VCLMCQWTSWRYFLLLANTIFSAVASRYATEPISTVVANYICAGNSKVPAIGKHSVSRSGGIPVWPSSWVFCFNSQLSGPKTACISSH
jgi:hypothetical protein